MTPAGPAADSSPCVADLAQHFRDYKWEGKHALYGYPPDVDRKKVVTNVRLKLSLGLWRQGTVAQNPATTRLCVIREANSSLCGA